MARGSRAGSISCRRRWISAVPRPVPLGRGDAGRHPRLPRRLTHWICENAKSARAYLKRVGELQPLALPLREQSIVELPRHVHKKGDHEGGFDARPLLAPALEGHDVGLVSEAGMPAIADPGSSVVRAAHELGVPVVPLVGPVSLLLTLAASGLNGQNFAFVGYLPQDAAQRTQRIRELEVAGAARRPDPAVHRNAVSQRGALGGAVEDAAAGTRLAVGSGLTLAAAAGPQPAGRRLAPAGGAGARTTRRPCSRSAVEAPTRRSVCRDVPMAAQRSAGIALSACMAPSPMAAPNLLASRSATFSRRV